MKRICALLLALALCLSMMAVGGFAEEEQQKGLQKFDHVVELHIAFYKDPMDSSLAQGEDMENNYYTRYLLENYNIKIVVDWSASGDDFYQKLALSIVLGDLPDAFITNHTYWKEAAESGLLMDITDIFNEYACEKIKNAYAVTDGKAAEACMVDGQMYGLANTVVQSDGILVGFIRQDWLDAVNLSAPTTLDELETVAKAFKDAKLAGDKTIPILGTGSGGSLYSNFSSSTNVWYGFDPIFAAYNAAPGYFIKKDGKVVYGTFTEETKQALTRLADWYKQGLIDIQLGTRSDSSIPMNANQAGMFTGPWWAVGYGNASSFYNSADADWQSFVLNNEDGEWVVKTPDLYGASYLCINAEASEEAAIAAMIAVNAMTMYETNMVAETNTNINSWYPLRLVIDTPDIVEHEYAELQKVLSGEADPEDYKDETTYVFMYGDAKAAKKVIKDYTPGELLRRSNFEVSTDSAEWQRLYSILIGDRCLATRTPDVSIDSVIYNHTSTTERYWDNLWNAEMETVLKIVTGQLDISALDELETRWMREGGEQILNDLNKTYGD